MTQIIKVILLVLIGLCSCPFGTTAQNKPIDSLKQIVGTKEVDTSVIMAMNSLSEELVQIQSLEEALSYAKKAKELSVALDFKRGEAYALKNMGIVEYYKGNYALVLEHWFKAADIFESIPDELGVSNIANNLGVFYYGQGNSVKALEYYLKSLRMSEKLKDTLRISTALLNVAGVYMQMGAYEKAVNYQERIEPYLEHLDDPQISAGYLMGFGEIFSKTDDHKKALKFYKDALPMTKGTPGYAHNLTKLGKAHFKLGNMEQATIYLDSAYQVAVKNSFPLDQVQTLIALGEIFQRTEPVLAIQYFDEAKELALDLEIEEELRDIYYGYSRAYANLEDFENAYKAQSIYMVKKDSLFNLKIADKVRGLQFEFDLQKKQDQIGLLQAEAELTEMRGKRQKYIIYGSTISLVLVLVVAVGTFSRYRYIKKTSNIIVKEKERSEKLLLNILPNETAMELKQNGKVEAKKFESVSVMFTDFKGFTVHSQNLSPELLVKTVDYYFSRFDLVMEKYGLEKIKTIGDAYMCAAGLPFPSNDHATKIIEAAFEITDIVEEIKQNPPPGIKAFEIRIGINSGPVVAGVVGTKKFAYDIWGDAVNVASRMESMSEPGKINISQGTYELVKDQYQCKERGEVYVKNKGNMKMYYVIRKAVTDNQEKNLSKSVEI